MLCPCADQESIKNDQFRGHTRSTFGLTHAPSHKQTDAVQVGGQYRQCNGVCKPIGAVVLAAA